MQKTTLKPRESESTSKTTGVSKQLNLCAPLSITQKEQSNKAKSPGKTNGTVTTSNPNLEIGTRDNKNKEKMHEQEEISAIEPIASIIEVIESEKPQETITEVDKATTRGPNPWASLFQQNRTTTHG